MRRAILGWAVASLAVVLACSDRNVDPADLPPPIGLDGAVPPDASEPPDAGVPLHVFVTSQSFQGNLIAAAGGVDPDGLSAADRLCKQAGNPVSTNRWRAYLATGTVLTPSQRVEGAGPWQLPNGGAVVFADRTALESAFSAPLVPILTNELGTTVPAGTMVWTGVANSHCSNWTDASSGNQGTVGDPSMTTTAWVASGPAVGCDGTHPLYCFEAPP